MVSLLLGSDTGVPTTGSNVVRPYGNGSPNDNSDRLTMLCDMHDLTILGSWFKRLDIYTA